MTSVRNWRPSLWLRAHPLVVDRAVAILWAAICVPSLFLTAPYETFDLPVREPDLPGVLLTLLACAPLAVRRRYPLGALIAITVPVVALAGLNYAGLWGLTAVVATYTAAAYETRGKALAALAVSLLAVTIGLGVSDQVFGAADYVSNLAILLASWAFGRSIAFRRAYTAELEERASRLEAAREADVRAVVAEERSRIARELHDVVAHHVSVMTVQAAAAQRTMSRDVTQPRRRWRRSRPPVGMRSWRCVAWSTFFEATNRRLVPTASPWLPSRGSPTSRRWWTRCVAPACPSTQSSRARPSRWARVLT